MDTLRLSYTVATGSSYSSKRRALVSISYFCCHFALAVMALCSRRSRNAFGDAPGSTLDVSPSLLRSSLPKASEESLQGLAEHGFVHAGAWNGLLHRTAAKHPNSL